MPPASFFHAENALKSLAAGAYIALPTPHSWLKRRERGGVKGQGGRGKRDRGGRERSGLLPPSSMGDHRPCLHTLLIPSMLVHLFHHHHV